MWPYWIGIVIRIAVVLTLSVILIKKKLFPKPISIFMILFIIGQVIGYGMDIDFLKVHTLYRNSIGNNGISTSIASTAIPLTLAFIIDYTSRLFKRAQN